MAVSSYGETAIFLFFVKLQSVVIAVKPLSIASPKSNPTTANSILYTLPLTKEEHSPALYIIMNCDTTKNLSMTYQKERARYIIVYIVFFLFIGYYI